MNKEQQETFRNKLDELVAELNEDLESNQDSTRTVDLDTSIGRLSRMDAMQSQQMALEVKIPAQRAGHWFGVYKTPGLSPQRGLSDSVVPTGSVIG